MSALRRSRPESCLSDLVLDRLVVGELERSAETAAHLLECRDCRARLEELERDFRGFDVEAHLPRAPRRVAPWAGGFAALAAAAAVLVMVLRPPQPPGVRYKGGFQLELIARHASDGRVERILPGAELSPGDSVRFRVTHERGGHLIVLGIDAAGQVTPYVPALPLGPTREQILDGSIVLDATLGPERVVAIACAQPIATERAVDAAKQALGRAAGDPRRVGDLGLGCAQSASLFVKVLK